MGVYAGPGDRIVSIVEGADYGFPYYQTRGCSDCPRNPAGLQAPMDWLTLADFTQPQGIHVFRGGVWPADFDDTLFVALSNGGDSVARIVWLQPDAGENGQPRGFGLCRRAATSGRYDAGQCR